MEDFGSLPGNSHSEKLKKEQQKAGESEQVGPLPGAQKQYDEHQKDGEPKQVRKVVTGTVRQRRKPLGTRLKEMFASEDGDTFGHYLVENVVVPMMKDMVLSVITQTADGIRGGIEERLFGSSTQSRTRTTSYGTGRPVVNYTRYSSSSTNRPSSRPSTHAPRITVRRSNKIQDIILGTREDGEDVLDELKDKVDGFGHCTVGDLYTAVGITPTSTDHGWGWDDLDQARVRRLATDEYLLVMPRPIEIEN
ncbi:hypothetical protein SEA_KARDASHIAN_51 [Streptomyces phage Kardashian]|nr:hypothetical protein SEA_KARDASHIAN_51 [Streptomyces phage Kardashian]